MRQALAQGGVHVSIRKMCAWLQCPRSAVYRAPRRRGRYPLRERLVREVRAVIDPYPCYGVRRITWAINQQRVDKGNWKAVHRVVRRQGWSMHKRAKGFRPRTGSWRSATAQPNQQWAIDTTHFSTQHDGWCQITAVIECCDRMIVGWRISRSGKADIAAAALDDALIRRNPPPGLLLRSDNGLVFGAEAFQKTVRGACVRQQYITPYTPEQNGTIERWFRTLKEECIWLNNLGTLDDARLVIDDFIMHYNTTRPHQALGMLSPTQWREQYAA